jgi:hypothetical protein
MRRRGTMPPRGGPQAAPSRRQRARPPPAGAAPPPPFAPRSPPPAAAGRPPGPPALQESTRDPTTTAWPRPLGPPGAPCTRESRAPAGSDASPPLAAIVIPVPLLLSRPCPAAGAPCPLRGPYTRPPASGAPQSDSSPGGRPLLARPQVRYVYRLCTRAARAAGARPRTPWAGRRRGLPQDQAAPGAGGAPRAGGRGRGRGQAAAAGAPPAGA